MSFLVYANVLLNIREYANEIIYYSNIMFKANV